MAFRAGIVLVLCAVFVGQPAVAQDKPDRIADQPNKVRGDEITEAKKAYGTVHLALGDSANEYGGTVECDVHLDGLVMSPTVAFDGRDVVVDGRHLYAGGLDG